MRISAGIFQDFDGCWRPHHPLCLPGLPQWWLAARTHALSRPLQPQLSALENYAAQKVDKGARSSTRVVQLDFFGCPYTAKHALLNLPGTGATDKELFIRGEGFEGSLGV